MGNGDLLEFIKKTGRKFKIEHYDIDPKIEGTIKQDTLSNPPNYNKKFIITNPPYLARNKSDFKEIYDLYDTNDLYKAFIKELIKQDTCGGILIIPLNFWCSIRQADIQLRKSFIQKYLVIRVNIFEERVFNDTSYAVCSFLYVKKPPVIDDFSIDFYIYPSKKHISTELNEENNYSIGGHIYNLPVSPIYNIGRLIKGMKPTTNILLKCIDDNINSKLGLSIVDDNNIHYDNTPKHSERSYATITLNPIISLEKQKKLVEDFNNFIEGQRNKYHSLFLTNYRESNSIARKRISFDLAYRIIGHLLLDQN